VTLDLDELELRAKAETPGPWRVEMGSLDKGGAHVLTAAPSDRSWTDSPMIVSHYFYPHDDVDFAFIAAANPAAVLTLIARVRELEAGLVEACDYLNGWLETETQHGNFHDDPEWRRCEELRALAKGER